MPLAVSKDPPCIEIRMISLAELYPPAGDNGKGEEQAIGQQAGAEQPAHTEPVVEKPQSVPEEPKCIPKAPQPKPAPVKKKARPRPVTAKPAPRPSTIETTGDSDTQKTADAADEPGHVPSGNTSAGQGGGSQAGVGASGAGRPGVPGGSMDSAFGAVNGPRFANQVRPKYPSVARQLGKEGTVLLRLTIDERGRLVEVEVLAKAGAGFEEEAIRAVKESTYLPARANGQPVKSRAVLPIRFVLKNSG